MARLTAVVHVLYRTADENISDEQVRSQIDVLNADFRKRNADVDKVPPAFQARVADALVEFALATEDPDGRPTSGITRTETRRRSFDGEIAELDEQIKVASGARALAGRPLSQHLGVHARRRPPRLRAVPGRARRTATAWSS